MSSAPPSLASAPLGALDCVRHAFYGREGGVSEGAFASLNCSPFAGDAPQAVRANRERVARGLGAADLFTNHQVHGARVRVIGADADPSEVVRADGLVTREARACLGVLAADCAPVLFADAQARVIGAAHAGWRGALLGVTDAVIAAMTALGARPARIVCAIGPAIQAASYRVGAPFRRRFFDGELPCEEFFGRDRGRDGDQDEGGYFFDLPGYLRRRIARAGVAAPDVLPDDTFADSRRFFSYRRSCTQGEKDYGRQIGAIALV
ncbi:MAG: polyphenol oxidase family protein [Gammaproteobacteria bacterium]|nr:polyphenol oxidase family protein [Gammaproteobacteria bacterium]